MSNLALPSPKPEPPAKLLVVATGFLAASFLLSPSEAQQPNERPRVFRGQQLEGVLACTLQPPELSGDANVDRGRRAAYEMRLDRIVRVTLKDQGRLAVVSAPLAATSIPFEIVFVAHRNLFDLFIEKNESSSSVYAVFRGGQVSGIPGEMVHMSAASGGFARKYECLWTARDAK